MTGLTEPVSYSVEDECPSCHLFVMGRVTFTLNRQLTYDRWEWVCSRCSFVNTEGPTNP